MKKGVITIIGIVLVIAAYGLAQKTHSDALPVAVNTGTDTYRENQKEGSADWKTHVVFPDVSNTWTDDRQIYGYANLTSINRGESIQLKISTKKPTYSIQVYRMGWYGGTGARLVKTVTGLKGEQQQISELGQEDLLSLDWKTSYVLQTEVGWTSGIYLAKLTTNDSDVGFIMFVVRDDSSSADIVYQLPVATYSAYNNWGGKSLYDFNSTDGRAHKVSLDRPYAPGLGAGFFFDGDYNMVRWLESKGYEVSYITSVDVERDPEALNKHKVFLSNWHDEYWSKNMRDHLTSALASGVDLAFFDANTLYQQIRFEKSLDGRPNRTIVCYKDAALDPISKTDPKLTTIPWRQDPVNQPENALLGVMYIGDFEWGKSFPWVVTNADHWIYEGTGLKNKDNIPGLIGYEYDAVVDNGHTPPNIEVLSASPVKGKDGKAISNSAIYATAKGARVFSAGTIYWAWKLDDNDLVRRGADPRVQRMTANILDAMIHDLHLR